MENFQRRGLYARIGAKKSGVMQRLNAPIYVRCIVRADLQVVCTEIFRRGFSETIPNATATYQWYRVDASNNATAISGATSSSYAPTAADVGYRIRVTAIGTGCFQGTATATHGAGTIAARINARLADVFDFFDWDDEFVDF